MPGTTRGLAGTGTTSRKSNIGVRPDPRRIRRTKALKDRWGVTSSEIYDRGLAALEMEDKLDTANQFSLHIARGVRESLSLFDYEPFDDPDAEHEAEQEYMQGRPQRFPRPLREGARAPGAKVRDTL